MRVSEEDYLAHYGIQRKSGRYPWGSGKNPHQRSMSFLDITNDLKKNHGMTDSQIAKLFDDPDHPFTVSTLKELRTRAIAEKKLEQIRTVQKLEAKGMSRSAIARQMGLNESTIRSLQAPGRKEKLAILQATADMLKQEVEEKGFVDVGANVERDIFLGGNPEARIGISREKFSTALSILKEEGYSVHKVPIPQVGTHENTNYLVLVKPGVTQKDAWENRFNISTITKASDDGGRTYNKDLELKPPLNISSKRVAIKYKEDGGADADGVIYVRPGVKDVSLGKARYAQVRIAIDNSHYLKGMAIYKDDLPPGIDLMFNTNKSNTGDKFDAMKPFKTIDKEGTVDPKNPFGAAIKIGGQIKDDKGNVTSAMNLINEEGDWNTWANVLSRQVLSKQSPVLAKSQLDLTYENRQKEFEKIKSLTNPVIKQELLKSFSDETDSAAVHLKAAHMPRQATKVILPSNHVKPTEVFAPTFKDGERVVLIRFPHAGTFEIPELTVNSRSREVRKMFGGKKDAADAVVIHPDVAAHLSGADFDGDHVIVIPNERGAIKLSPALENLKNFDPKMYAVPLGPPTDEHPKGTPIITDSQKQDQMGVVSNLIADMTIKGASTEELARAVRHSMVVIDSEKHNLDYKASARDHDIRDLKLRYQGQHDSGALKGASTLITRANSEIRVNARKPRPAAEGGPINRVTGAKEFVPTGQHVVRYKDANGKLITKPFRSKELAEQFVREHQPNGRIEPKRFKSQKLAETTDAHKLVSDHGGTKIEEVYAEHSNKLKSLANQARLEMINTKPTPMSPSAKKVYAAEVESLQAQLNKALLNSPLASKLFLTLRIRNSNVTSLYFHEHTENILCNNLVDCRL